MDPRDGEWPVGIRAKLEPARQVGGDLIDFFPLGAGHCCFLLGDVSGRPAAAPSSWRAPGTFAGGAVCRAQGRRVGRRRDMEAVIADERGQSGVRVPDPVPKRARSPPAAPSTATPAIRRPTACARRGAFALPLIGGMPVGIDDRVRHLSGAIELAPRPHVVHS
jgi:sigma-B regulation protein RsbU (phosphoserine phosphatase)